MEGGDRKTLSGTLLSAGSEDAIPVASRPPAEKSQVWHIEDTPRVTGTQQYLG